MTMRKPREVDVVVQSTNADGLGVAELEGRSLHVRNALRGEQVRARIVRKKRGSLFADAVEVIQASAQRVASACVNFPRCGGCSFHHLRYADQLRVKQTFVETCLAEQGVTPRAWVAAGSSIRLGYRTKARLGVRKLGDQVLIGFRESFSNRVARMQSCEVLSPRFSKMLPALQAMVGSLSVADAVPQIELAEGDRRATIIVRHVRALSEADQRALANFARDQGVQVLLQAKGYDTLRCANGGSIELLDYVLADFGLNLRFHPIQFTQVNLAMNRQLVRRVARLFGSLDGKHIVDMFCGIGNFTLPLARLGAQAYGYELGEDTVAMASRNAEHNGLTADTHFASIDLYHDLPELPSQFDGMLLDPPRSGAGPRLPEWLVSARAAGCRDIVYVSCNPKTFASDAVVLADAGYSLAEVGIHDMFPYTNHVETLGWFIRTDQ